MDEKPKRKKDKVKQCKVEEDEIVKKKPPMKTVMDVISRLLWDEDLPSRLFTVGYLDRFDGIVEKSFDSLDWRDPAIVDNNTLAIPKHRIQYFKYCNRKVWDKRTRLDIIFGSTGDNCRIHDFILNVDFENLNFQDEYLRDANSDDDEVISEEECDMRGRPNFFIAARINNPITVSNIKEVSDYIKSKDVLLGGCCIDPDILHITLTILKLDNPLQISNAIESMKAMSFSPISLNIKELDNFMHRVLYARVEKNSCLMELRDCLVNELSARDVCITDKHSFVPHVTVAKLSRPVSRIRHSKFIDQYLYLKFEDNDFGTQEIDSLYLCEMGSNRQDDGFYKCAYVASYQNNEIEI